MNSIQKLNDVLLHGHTPEILLANKDLIFDAKEEYKNLSEDNIILAKELYYPAVLLITKEN